MARFTAEERRQAVLDAAVAEFAGGGLNGTSTEDIARQAGISQPYLFRLYPNKKALFIASVEAGFERIIDTFEHAARGLDDDDALEAMGQAYTKLLEDRDLLLMQLHAYAACSDPEIRAATRRAFRRMWSAISGLAGHQRRETDHVRGRRHAAQRGRGHGTRRGRPGVGPAVLQSAPVLARAAAHRLIRPFVAERLRRLFWRR